MVESPLPDSFRFACLWSLPYAADSTTIRRYATAYYGVLRRTTAYYGDMLPILRRYGDTIEPHRRWGGSWRCMELWANRRRWHESGFVFVVSSSCLRRVYVLFSSSFSSSTFPFPFPFPFSSITFPYPFPFHTYRNALQTVHRHTDA